MKKQMEQNTRSNNKLFKHLGFMIKKLYEGGFIKSYIETKTH